MRHFLEQAIEYARKRDDSRTFLVAAIGIRADGAVVRARNESVGIPQRCAHAEARLVKKLGRAAEVVYIARYRPGTGDWGIAKPCHNCERVLRWAKVKKVVYTSGPNEFQTEWLH